MSKPSIQRPNLPQNDMALSKFYQPYPPTHDYNCLPLDTYTLCFITLLSPSIKRHKNMDLTIHTPPDIVEGETNHYEVEKFIDSQPTPNIVVLNTWSNEKVVQNLKILKSLPLIWNTPPTSSNNSTTSILMHQSHLFAHCRCNNLKKGYCDKLCSSLLHMTLGNHVTFHPLGWHMFVRACT